MRLAFTKEKWVVLWFLALFSVVVPVEAQQAKASAKTILNRMAQSYARYRSYQDEGLVITTYDEPTGGRIEKLPFKTHFKRPNLLRFEWIDYSPWKEGRTYIIWSNGKESFTYWQPDRYEKAEDLGMAIAGATGISRGSAQTVSRLLLGDEGIGFSVGELDTPSLVSEEMFGGALCYRIKGKDSQGGWDELWIGKKDLLLRKVREETKYPDYVAIQEETHQNIRINEPIASDVFDFKPPIALTQEKESKPGSGLIEDETPTWSEFTPPEGHFSLLMPAEPHSQTITVESAKGRFEHHIYKAVRGWVVCIVDYVDLPKQSVLPGNERALFDAARDEFLQGSQGKLLSETAVSMDGHAGREMKINTHGGKARMRVFLIDGRFYLLAILEMDAGSKPGDEMDKFFNSFKVLPAGKPTAFHERKLDSPGPPVMLPRLPIHQALECC